MIKKSLVITVLTSLAASAAFGAEWRIEPILRAAYETDDNATLSILTIDEPDISGSIADVSAKFSYASPLTRFEITPQYVDRNYGDEDFDGDEQFLKFRFDRQNQSSRFQFRGRYTRELARTAERVDADLDIDDPDEIPVEDSGRVVVRDYRELFELTPRFTYQITDASALRIDLRYTDVTYDEELADLLTDYTNARVNLNFSRAWSPRNKALLRLTYREYEAEGSEAQTGIGLSGGFEARVSEKTTLRALVGLEDTEDASGESDVNPVADISLTRNLETITFLAQYRRVISGGGSGSLTERDIFNINFKRQLSDLITAGIGVRAYATSATSEGATTINERDYVQLRAQFIWNLSNTISLEANYRYTVLDRATLGESANSNNISLWLNWRPKPYSSAK